MKLKTKIHEKLKQRIKNYEDSMKEIKESKNNIEEKQSSVDLLNPDTSIKYEYVEGPSEESKEIARRMKSPPITFVEMPDFPYEKFLKKRND